MRWILIICLFTNMYSCLPKESPTAPPNIIFLLSDDQRWDMVGINGNEVIQTPNLDNLARKGANFVNHYVTTSICSVSRASILSGQYGSRHQLWGFGQGFDKEAFDNTYPMILKRNGYFTGFIGKYGVGSILLPSAHFDYWNGFGGQGNYSQINEDGTPIHLTQKIGNQVIDFIQRVPNDQPFCLSVSFKAPHVQDGAPISRIFPYDLEYQSMYTEVVWEKPLTAAPEYFDHFNGDGFGQNNVARQRYRRRFDTEERYDRSLEGYYRLVHGIDVQLGRMIKELEIAGLADNTIIIYTSDNGFYLGEYGFAGKWYGSEPSIRTPLIIHDPRMAAVGEVEGISLNIDLAPTILNYAGITAPANYQGQTLLPLITGESGEIRSSFLYEHLWPLTPGYVIPSTEGVVTKTQKYMRYFPGLSPDNVVFEEFYDLVKDHHETRNLISDPDYESERNELKELLEKYKVEVK
ncbi:sulfatase family protein [Portibacter marinus]|uniref:sulfatase family protein n=1 Tax=Portibacter marinus TaxID=2898660 RepID=UPI001F1CF2A0|nr:sulfatase [Portibacter marinus]